MLAQDIMSSASGLGLTVRASRIPISLALSIPATIKDQMTKF